MLAYSDGIQCLWEDGLGKRAKLEGGLCFLSLYSKSLLTRRSWVGSWGLEGGSI